MAEHRWHPRQRLVIALCFAINMIDGMDVLVVSYIAPRLQAEWGVDPARFGAVFSAGLGGMAVGGLAIAPLADRFGRRRLILAALSLMATAMALSGLARGLADLLALRVAVGIGIGTVLAAMGALAADIAPAGRRDFAVGVLQAGYPVGATITGFAVARLLPLYGWRDIFMGTAVVTVAMVPPVWLLVTDAAPAPERGLPDRRGAIGALFADGRLRSSLLLWGATIGGSMVLYFVVSWITTLAIRAGLDQTRAIVAGAVYNIGAFAGTLALSVSANRLALGRLIASFLTAAGVLLLVFGGVTMGLPGVLLAAFAIGATLAGFNGLYPLIARVYPPDIRATGLGWATGIGRIGAFTGPLLGGWLLALNLPLVAIFGVFCVPLAIAAVCAMAVRPVARG